MAKKTTKKKGISQYTLPERLKYLRISREMTQADLAKISKVSQSTIAQIESGRKDPSINTLKQIATALEIEIAVLFASDDVHVFDMNRLEKNYRRRSDLNDTLYRAVSEVLRWAKKIGM